MAKVKHFTKVNHEPLEFITDLVDHCVCYALVCFAFLFYSTLPLVFSCLQNKSIVLLLTFYSPRCIPSVLLLREGENDLNLVLLLRIDSKVKLRELNFKV